MPSNATKYWWNVWEKYVDNWFMPHVLCNSDLFRNKYFTWEIIRATWRSRDRRPSWRPAPRTQRPRCCPPGRPSRWRRPPPGPGWPAAWRGWGRWRGSWGSGCSASWSPRRVSSGGGSQPGASRGESAGNMRWSRAPQCSRSLTGSRTPLRKILWSPSSLNISPLAEWHSKVSSNVRKVFG